MSMRWVVLVDRWCHLPADMQRSRFPWHQYEMMKRGEEEEYDETKQAPVLQLAWDIVGDKIRKWRHHNYLCIHQTAHFHCSLWIRINHYSRKKILSLLIGLRFQRGASPFIHSFAFTTSVISYHQIANTNNYPCCNKAALFGTSSDNNSNNMSDEVAAAKAAAAEYKSSDADGKSYYKSLVLRAHDDVMLWCLYHLLIAMPKDVSLINYTNHIMYSTSLFLTQEPDQKQHSTTSSPANGPPPRSTKTPPPSPFVISTPPHRHTLSSSPNIVMDLPN